MASEEAYNTEYEQENTTTGHVTLPFHEKEVEGISDNQMNTLSSNEPAQPFPLEDTEVPRYSSVNASNVPPPSYESLFGRAKSVQETSSKTLDYVEKVLTNLMGTTFVLILLAISLGLPIAMLYMGGTYFFDCPLATDLPRCVLAGGILGVLRIFMSVRGMLASDEDGGGCCFPLCDCILFVYFIAVSVVVYINQEFSTDPDSQDFCDPTLYYFSFWLCTSVYILLSLCCCCCCTIIIYAVFNDDDDSETADIAMTEVGDGGRSQ